MYEPVKKNDELINCYFSENLNFRFCGKFTEGNDTKIKYCSAWQCYFCSNFLVEKINLNDTLKIAQVNLELYKILTLKLPLKMI